MLRPWRYCWIRRSSSARSRRSIDVISSGVTCAIAQRLAVEHPHTILADGTHPELRLEGNAELADDDDVERRVQGTRDFEPDWDTSAWKRKDHGPLASKMHQAIREQPSRLTPIVELSCHADPSSYRCQPDDLPCPSPAIGPEVLLRPPIAGLATRSASSKALRPARRAGRHAMDLRTIVVGLDGSSYARRAAEWAASLARVAGGVTVVAVPRADCSIRGRGGGFVASDLHRDEIEVELERDLVLAASAGGRRPSGRAAQGSPAPAAGGCRGARR